MSVYLLSARVLDSGTMDANSSSFPLMMSAMARGLTMECPVMAGSVSAAGICSMYTHWFSLYAASSSEVTRASRALMSSSAGVARGVSRLHSASLACACCRRAMTWPIFSSALKAIAARKKASAASVFILHATCSLQVLS